MPKFLLCLVMSVCLTCALGCGGGDKDAGHVNDPTPGGEQDNLEDTSPDALGEMGDVGSDPAATN